MYPLWLVLTVAQLIRMVKHLCNKSFHVVNNIVGIITNLQTITYFIKAIEFCRVEYVNQTLQKLLKFFPPPDDSCDNFTSHC